MQREYFDRIHFKTRADVEFILCLLELAQGEDKLKSIKNKTLPADNDSVEMLSAMYGKIPDNMRKEIKYFFSDMEVVWGIVGYEFQQTGNKNIADMLNNLKEQEGTALVFNVFDVYMYYNAADEQEYKDIRSFQSDTGAMLTAVRKTKTKNKSLKQKVIKILENHMEFQHGLCLLLSGFYEDIYMPVEDNINACLINIREKYQSLFHKDPQHFIDLYLKFDMISPDMEFNIHVSYFIFYCYLWINPGYWDKTFILLGSSNDKNQTPEGIVSKQVLQKLFKILADKSRFDIICALNNRPHYNLELAEKFGLSPSTVNYHLGAMLEMDIVSIGREDHRIYYTLKKDVLENLLGNSMKIMF